MAVKKKVLRFGEGFRVGPGNARAQAAVMVIAPGDAEGDPKNRHRGSDQWLYVVDGEGRALVNGRWHALRPGILLLIEAGDRHEVRNTGRSPLETVNLYVPPASDAHGQ